MITESANTTFSSQFAELTTHWNAHQDLRRSGATVAELSASRIALDAVRGQLHEVCVAA